MINETVVYGRKFRQIIDPITKNWIRTDPSLIAEKYRMNAVRKFKPIDKSKITFRKRTDMEDSLIITEFYKNFGGRIITTESVMYDNTEEKISVEWDCGTTRCSISTELVDKLNLKPCGISNTLNTTESASTNVYEIVLVLHDIMEIPIIVDAVPNIHSTGIDMLIGMDVICLGDFAISNYNGETCFSFRYPSKGLIDFNKE